MNNIDTYGQSPIFYAAREGHLEVIKRLVSYGGDPDLVDNNRQTPIYYAIKGNRIDVVEYLLQNNAKTGNIDHKNQTPYQFAKKSNKPAIVELLKKYNAVPEQELQGKGNLKKAPQVAAAAAVAAVVP